MGNFCPLRTSSRDCIRPACPYCRPKVLVYQTCQRELGWNSPKINIIIKSELDTALMKLVVGSKMYFSNAAIQKILIKRAIVYRKLKFFMSFSFLLIQSVEPSTRGIQLQPKLT